MRRWVLPLAAIGLSHAAGASELDVGYLRGSGGPPNYQVIQTPAQEWNAATYRSVIGSPAAPVVIVPPPVPISEWEFEFGSRVWFSTGKIQQDLFDQSNTQLLSRLTYPGLTGASGELFGRVEHVNGWFVKGFLGAGVINGGQLFDEDFPGVGETYSNTLSPQNHGDLEYATLDAGYDFIRAAGSKLGVFVGYNYYRNDVNVYGCTQIAGNPFICGPAPFSPAINPNAVSIEEQDAFNSLRVGLDGEFQLTDRLKLSADAAYLPYTSMQGEDIHVLRGLTIPENGQGDGVQLQAVLTYNIFDNWDLGVGGRYWYWRIPNANVPFCSGEGTTTCIPSEHFTPMTIDRYGGFAQLSYRFGDVTTPVIAASPAYYKALPPPLMINWTGFYAGAHLGAGWGNTSWSDPSGSVHFAPIPGVYFDAPGFGQTTPVEGPLGGVQVGYNLQFASNWVGGIEADYSAARLDGTNTCFSATGGVQCAAQVSGIETVAARFGYAWDRSWIYGKAGGALAQDQFAVDANTEAYALARGGGLFGGISTVNQTRVGADLGVGLEYALLPNVSAKLEYDYILLGSRTANFTLASALPPDVLIAPNSAISQNVQQVKFGVNYRFCSDIAGVVAKY